MMRAIDKNNLDGEFGATAILLDWPKYFSSKARWALRYFDGTAFLYRYMGKLIVTDEALWLTVYNGEGYIGGPRGEFKNTDEVEAWLEEVTDYWKDEYPELGDY